MEKIINIRKKYLIIAVLALFFIAAVLLVYRNKMGNIPINTNIPESEITVTFSTGKDNQLKIKNIGTLDSIKSPLIIEGEARGTWFFEASFPIKLIDDQGEQITVGIAQAQSEWMTTEFVPFRVILNFSIPTARTGTLILEKDNPSGLPEHADELRIPIRFAAASAKPCVITGCSGQICSEEEVITTCEYQDKYACYKNALCERQSDGECGWTQTPELQSCLNKQI